MIEIKMPRMGESIIEATITKWLKNIGDNISEDEPIAEIATDKVDSEIPSPASGKLIKQLFKEGDVAAVDSVIAIIESDLGAEDKADLSKVAEAKVSKINDKDAFNEIEEIKSESTSEIAIPSTDKHGRFYSPLVRSIAKQENISNSELENIPGTGAENRLTKSDIINYLKKISEKPAAISEKQIDIKPQPSPTNVFVGKDDEIIEMDRMRRLIASHMIASEATSVHITMFAEADVTNIVNWREKNKNILLKRENEKLTYTPIFIEAVAKALKDFPMINVSVDGNRIILRKNINIGVAAALPNGNLIVPVIKNADHKNLLGITKELNDLATRSRENQLKPYEIQGGTFTITNIGTFGSIMGTPIINQPEVAILGVGVIKKRPVVIETPDGDTIGIRQMMYLSLSCDHRVVDGALGGMFLQRIVENLENFNTKQTI